GDRNPGPATALRRLEFHLLALPNDCAAARRELRFFDPGRESTTAPGDASLIIKAETQATESDFEQGRFLRVAHEQIRDACGTKIERAAERNSLAAPLRAAEILHAREGSSPQNGY